MSLLTTHSRKPVHMEAGAAGSLRWHCIPCRKGRQERGDCNRHWRSSGGVAVQGPCRQHSPLLLAASHLLHQLGLHIPSHIFSASDWAWQRERVQMHAKAARYRRGTIMYCSFKEDCRHQFCKPANYDALEGMRPMAAFTTSTFVLK